MRTLEDLKLPEKKEVNTFKWNRKIIPLSEEGLNSLKKEFGSVEYEGKTLYFLEEPYYEGDITYNDRYGRYNYVVGYAIDDQGNKYRVGWKNKYQYDNSKMNAEELKEFAQSLGFDDKEELDEFLESDICDLYDHDDFEVELEEVYEND